MLIKYIKTLKFSIISPILNFLSSLIFSKLFISPIVNLATTATFFFFFSNLDKPDSCDSLKL